MKDVIDAEPLFSCVGCRDDYSWPASDLRVHEGCLWCDNCWTETDYNFKDRILWSELKPFVPAYATEIDELSKENEALKAREAELKAHIERLRSSVFAIVSNVTLAAIRNETLEKAAKVSDACGDVAVAGGDYRCECAEAIRAMKEEA